MILHSSQFLQFSYLGNQFWMPSHQLHGLLVFLDVATTQSHNTSSSWWRCHTYFSSVLLFIILHLLTSVIEKCNHSTHKTKMKMLKIKNKSDILPWHEMWLKRRHLNYLKFLCFLETFCILANNGLHTGTRTHTTLWVVLTSNIHLNKISMTFLVKSNYLELLI